MTGAAPNVPDDDGRPKSFTIGKFLFRRDGAGYEAKEIIGTGKDRKRKYLAYLRRDDYDRMKGDPDQLLAWAEEKRAGKGG